jgi:hypothetical protein
MPRAKGMTDEYELAPQGVHPAVCADVVELGMQDTPWGPKNKIRLVWQIAELDTKGKRHTVVKKYTLSLHKKANLSLDLESWRGKTFTKEEQDEGFEVNDIVGATCLLNVQHNLGTEGRMYANVVAIMPLSKGMEKLEISPDFVRRKDRTDQPQQGGHAPSADEVFPPTFEDSEVPF